MGFWIYAEKFVAYNIKCGGNSFYYMYVWFALVFFFSAEKEKDKAFESFILDPDDELVKELLQSGYDGLDFMKGKA